MGRNIPDPRKKAWKNSTPSYPKEKTFFEPLSEAALKSVSEDVIRSKLIQLDEVEESYMKYADISVTAYARARARGEGHGPTERQVPNISKRNGRRVRAARAYTR